ncbi:MAG: hypothetical protein ACOCV2_13860, partial [Persicimonas sp.]
MRYATRLLSLFALVSFASMAFASTAAAESTVYDWPDENRPVLIENDSGLIFISNEKEPDRVYEWDIENKAEDFDPVYMVDLGEEDGYEIVGSGNPMFVLQTNG